MHAPIGNGNAGHATGPQVGIFAQGHQGQVATIGPAGEQYLVGDGVALRHQPGAGGHDILYFPMPYVTVDFGFEFAAKGGAAAIVNGQPGKAVV